MTDPRSLQLKANTFQNFKAIKDKPLTVFIAMVLLGGHATYTQLEYWCEYSRPTLRKAMFPLFQLGLIKPVTQSKFVVSDNSEQLKLFAEKFFQADSSSINTDSIDILKIESTTTTSCKSFSALPEIKEYLARKGVWEAEIGDIAEIAENDLTFLKAHFEGTDTALAVHRIRNQKPADNKQCPQCGLLSCGCKYTHGEFSEYIEH